MKRISYLLTCISLLGLSSSLYSQVKTYNISGSEIIFSWGDMKYTQEFMNTYDQAEITGNPVRFTMFFHIQQFWHLDLNNSIGFFTGVGLRNIGQISNEYLPNEISDTYSPENPYTGDYFESKVIRRTYSVGIPLAIKLGSFKDHLNVYAGGEMEWAFHMKQKWWKSDSRSGTKAKQTNWWPEQITTFLPSTFVGVQFPGGVNLKFKYYLDNFLNHNYKGYNGTSTNEGTTQNLDKVVSNLTKYENSQLFYISLSFQFKTSELMESKSNKGTVAYRY